MNVQENYVRLAVFIPELEKHAHRILKNDDAKDVVMSAIMKIANAYDLSKMTDNEVKALAHVVVKNECMNILNDYRRYVYFENLDDNDCENSDTYEPPSEPEDKNESVEDEEVKKFLLSLNPRQKLLVLLSLENVPAREIAFRLRYKNAHSVSSMKYYIIQKLKSYLSRKGYRVKPVKHDEKVSEHVKNV